MAIKKPGDKKPLPGKSTSKAKAITVDDLTFEKYFNGSKGLYLFIGLAVFIGSIVFWNYLTFKNLYLFKDIGSDTVNFSYPQFIYLRDYLHSEGMPKWSMNQGMGQNIFPFILRDPFDLFLYAMDRNSLAYGIIYIEFIKIILGGLFFYLYLKTIRMTTFVSVIGGLVFSFCGFMILGSGWYIFTYEALCAAVLLYSFERLFLHNKNLLFPIVIAFISASMPFNLYLYGVFFLIYVLFRYFSEKEWNPKQFSGLMLKLIGLGLLGVAISGVFFFSNVQQLIESPRVSGESSYFQKLSSTPFLSTSDANSNVTSIMRLFSSDLLGTGLSFKGAYNYLEAPLLYCGLLILLLVPQVFSFISKRNKIIYSVFLAIWILPVIFPFFRYAFWLFSGDYYRAYSFFVSFALIITGLIALRRIETEFKINYPVLIITVIVLFILLYYPYFPGVNPVEKDVRSVVTLFLVAYALIIAAFGYKKFKFNIQVITLFLLVIELSYLSHITVNKRNPVSEKEFYQKTGYNDYSLNVIDSLNKNDKDWYRIDKYYGSGPAVHASLNDALIQNYKGTSCYYSFNQKYYINFLQDVGIINGSEESQTRWASGLRGWPILESFGSVKYSLSKNPDNTFMHATFDSIIQVEDVKLFRNKNFLPLGFTYDRYMKRSDFKKMSNFQKNIMLLNAFVVEDSLEANFKQFLSYDLKDTTNNLILDTLAADANRLKTETLKITISGQSRIKGNIKTSVNKLLFFSIPYDKGWTALLDGQPAELQLVNVGFMGIPLSPGQHEVELNFYPRFVKQGAWISLAGLLIYALLIWWQRRKPVS
jgi:uncharacterized membrane protein YfhO